MDASDLHTKKTGNLLSQIAADPEMINRLSEEPISEVVAPGDEHGDGAGSVAPAQIVLLHPDEHLPAPVPAKGHKLVLLLIVAGIFLTVSGGGAAAYFKFRPAAVVVTASSTPTPTSTATPTLSPTPSVSATPSPTITESPAMTPSPSPMATPSPAPAEVSAPAEAPTAEHPQMVTVTNASGLWLRSTPSSASKKNIIAWMPKGAQVSVDSVGDFWWHGTYNGKTGYFAVSYTK